mgnify:CR=1 FL=1
MNGNGTEKRKNQWTKLLSPVRHNHIDPAHVVFDITRSPFIQDYDRILFSNSFRMLARKTQAHPFAVNDHVHHRLMHSLEVSSAGRSLGIMAGYFLKERGELPDIITPEHIGQIVQAACLAHDIGNPPFGHGGESALQDWFRDTANNDRYLSELTERQKADFKSFDGNAQGFRVVTALENHKDKGGLRLTYPTLATLVKYPRSAYDAIGDGSSKFNFYQSEKNTFDAVFSTLGLKDGNRYRRHPLSYLTEAADDICYGIIDMEDALELGIIGFSDLENVIAPVAGKLALNPKRMAAMDSDRRRAGLIRAKLIALMIDATFAAFRNHYDAIIMDPPSYGRGPKGEIWKIEDAIHPLIKLCTKILSDDPLFFLVNSYTTGLAPAVLTYMLATELKPWKGTVESQEIGLPVKETGLVLPCGASGRWSSSLHPHTDL